MALDRTLEVMAAVRSRLIGDAPVAALIAARVYDTAPEGVQAPYITIGQTAYFDSSTSDSEAQDFTVDVHCWDIPADRSNAKDTSRARALMGHVRRLFHDHALVVPGRNAILCRAERSIPVVADADEIHGVVSLRVLVGHE